MLRDVAKAAARGVANLVILPELLSYRLRSLLVGRDRALEASTQLLALVPGLSGQYLRRAFLARVLQHFDPTAIVEFGTIFSHTGTRIERHVYIGPHCHVGLAHFEPNVLLAAGVHVPSGAHTHRHDEPGVPIRDQMLNRQCVRIGCGTWIGCGAVILADVGRDCIVGAGSVVTRPVPDGVVAAGVPARVLHGRIEVQGAPVAELR